MSFGQAVKVCMSKVFVFEGRARRSEFWWFYLFLNLISTAVGLLFVILIFASMIPMMATASSASGPDDGAFLASFGAMAVLYLLLMVVSIGLSVMLLGAMARRLHDMGQTGHWLWLNLVGLGIVPLIMCILEGEAYTNQWGPDPKANERGFVAHAPVAYPAAAPIQHTQPVDGDPFATQQ